MKFKFSTIISIVIISLTCSFVSSQETLPTFDTEAELAKMANLPNSPEAQAFTKYGNTPVNMYHGNPNIQIPIYTHQGRELNLPVSLTYDASGIKVEQVASQVGLAWNLSAGGRVSRIANGYPDDYHPDYTSVYYYSFWDGRDDVGVPVRNRMNFYADLNEIAFSTQDSIEDYLEFIYWTYKNKYDTQPDYYTFSALGYSETIAIDTDSLEAKSLDNPRTIVEYFKPNNTESKSPIDGWKITLEDGVELYFNVFNDPVNDNTGIEITKSEANPDSGDGTQPFGFRKKYTSSWLLTKVVSPNNKDTYEFFYDHIFGQRLNYNASNVSGVQNNLSYHTPLATQTNLGYNNETYTIDQRMLSKIAHNGKTILVVEPTLPDERWDALDIAIDKIYIYHQDTNNQIVDLSKTFDLNYGYFRTEDEISPPYNSGNAPNMSNVRLKLDAVDVYDASDIYMYSYYMEYINPCDIASLTSKGQDYYGYYNGNDCVSGPSCVLYEPYNENGISLDGNPRNVSSAYSQNGTLNKIIYPTGGYTEFDYEQNVVDEPSGTETQWVHLGSVQINNVPLNPYNPNACNSKITGLGLLEPIIDVEAFEVTTSSLQYKFTLNKAIDPTANMPVFYYDNIVTLIKVADSSTTVTWEDIYDSNCAPREGIEAILNMHWTDNFSSQTSYTTLEPGHYRLVLANPSAEFSLNVQISYAIDVAVEAPVEKAGIRVKEIRDYDADNVLATQKVYLYSGGTVISQPIYSFIRGERGLDASQPDAQEIENAQILYRFGYSNATSKPHIGYSSVSENTINHLNPDESFSTTQSFYTTSTYPYRDGVYTYYVNGKETGKNYSVAFELGKQKSNKASGANSYTTVSTNEYETLPIELESIKGFSLVTDYTMSDLYPYPTDDSGQWRIGTVPANAVPSYGGQGTGTFDDFGMNGLAFEKPDECLDYLDASIADLVCSPEVARLFKQTVNAWRNTGHPISNTNTTIYNVTQDILQQITTNEYYDASNKFLLKKSTTTDSKGESVEQEFLYPDNFSGSEYNGLRSANIVSTPVETSVTKNGTLLATTKTEYADGSTLPSRILTAKGDDALESRLEFEQYENGSLVQARQVNAAPISYVWGYDNRYVVAKVENATYTQIENLSEFGSGFQLVGGLSAAQEAQLRGLTNVLVTTYDYNPNIGVNNIIDQNSQSTVFTYDRFNRLAEVRDINNSLLKKVEYNYKPVSPPTDDCNIPPSEPLNADGIAVSVDNASNPPFVTYTGSVIGLSGGQTPYNYTWEYSVNGGGYMPLGNASTFTLSYSANSTTNSFCSNYDPNDPNYTPYNITFRCTVSDSDSPATTLPVFTHVMPATCYNNQQ